MNVFLSWKDVGSNPAIRHLSLGFFDGLHIGHQKVICGQNPTAVLSFQNHPQSILQPGKSIPLITGIPHKTRILKAWECPDLILLPFNEETVRQTATAFLEELSHHLPSLESVSVGENFRFGHQRQGTPEFLHTWGTAHGFSVRIVKSLEESNRPVSSSRIRLCLADADLATTSILLGRTYSMLGTVVAGKQIGHTIGVPTANLDSEDSIILPSGVYAGKALIRQQNSITSLKAAINIGHKPTVGGTNKPVVEAHLLDFHGDLYGQTMELLFERKIRDEIRFDSLDQLKSQILSDLAFVRSL